MSSKFQRSIRRQGWRKSLSTAFTSSDYRCFSLHAFALIADLPVLGLTAKLFSIGYSGSEDTFVTVIIVRQFTPIIQNGISLIHIQCPLYLIVGGGIALLVPGGVMLGKKPNLYGRFLRYLLSSIVDVGFFVVMVVVDYMIIHRAVNNGGWEPYCVPYLVFSLLFTCV